MVEKGVGIDAIAAREVGRRRMLTVLDWGG